MSWVYFSYGVRDSCFAMSFVLCSLILGLTLKEKTKSVELRESLRLEGSDEIV